MFVPVESWHVISKNSYLEVGLCYHGSKHRSVRQSLSTVERKQQFCECATPDGLIDVLLPMHTGKRQGHIEMVSYFIPYLQLDDPSRAEKP
jgi:hypothetical protein